MMKEPGVEPASATWIGSGVPRFYLPLDQIFPQTNVSQTIVLPQGPGAARGAAQAPAGAAGRPSSPRCAAASSCCPTGRRCRTRCSSASSAPTCARCAPGPTRPRRSCAPTRTCAASTTTGTSRSRSLRLEIDQDKARALGVTSQRHRAGVAHDPVGHHDRPVPRGRQADRHRAAPAAGRAQRDHRPRQRLPAHRQRPLDAADADRHASASAGSRA